MSQKNNSQQHTVTTISDILNM